MVAPREPDRFDKQAREWKDAAHCMGSVAVCASCMASLAAALRAAESSALERAAQVADAWRERSVAVAIRALIPPAAAPAAETHMEKMLRVAGVRVLVEPCEIGGHYRNENGVTFHPSKCAAPPEGEGKS